MTVFRRRLRRARFFVQAALVTVIISAAVLVGFAQLALPWLADNPRRIEGWLSQRLGREVSVGRIEGAWTRAGPRLVLDDLRIGVRPGAEPDLIVPRAELALNLYAAFQKNRAWNEFRVVGMDLGLLRNAADQWQLRGFAAGSTRSMGALGALVLVDLDLSVIDSARGIKLDLRIPELRVVNLGDITRVLGQIGSDGDRASSLWLVADIDLAARSGSLHVGGRAIDVARLAAGHDLAGIDIVEGNGDVEVWSDWRNGRIDDIWIRTALRSVVFAATREVAIDSALSVLPRSAFDELDATVHWQRNGQGWKLDLANARAMSQGNDAATARVVVERLDDTPARYRMAGNGLDLGAAGRLAMLSGQVPAGLRRWLYGANPHGTLAAFDLRWDSVDDYDVDLRLQDFGCRSTGPIPGIESLGARLTGDAGSLLLEVPQQATRAAFPKVFRKTFEWTAFGGDVVAWRDGDAWHLRTAHFDVDAQNYAIDLKGEAELQGDGTRPLLDLSALVTRADVEAAKRFWTVNTMSPNTVEWLDRALVAGKVVEGRAMVRGDLDSWPFDDRAGRFEARADLKGLDLAFLPDWPSGEGMDVVARFINNGMLASARGGHSMGVGIESAEAAIPSFHDARLALDIRGDGAGADLLAYLRATPVGAQHAAILAGLGLGGRGDAHLELDIPLKDSQGTRLQGRVELHDAHIDEALWDLHFTGVNGPLGFDRSGVQARALQGKYLERPVELAFAIGSATSDPLNAFEAGLTGVLSTSEVFAKASDLAAAMDFFPGEASWKVDLAIGSESGAAAGRKALRLRSDLQGIAMRLPAPLEKPAESALPFSLELQVPPAGQPFDARLGEILHAQGRLPGPDTPFAAHIGLGGAPSETPLPAEGIAVAGRAARLDVDGWIRRFYSANAGAGLLGRVSLDVDELRLGGRDFAAHEIELFREDESTVIRVQGEALEGELNLPTVDMPRRGITAQMQRVAWPGLPVGAADGPGALAGVAPASLPPLHLWVGELKLGNSLLGETRLESYPTATGMRIDLLESKSDNLDMRANGEWTGAAGADHSHLLIDMSAGSLGNMLDAFGYVGIIDGGQTFARIDASWPGPPTAFALANTSGTLEVGVENGRFLDVDPGASGRLFGLLSLREIPRRLALDFSDLFKSGMSFNSVKGSFALADGNAVTDDLTIVSPAADITISGRTGLRSKDYDQEMVVVPRAGVALPVVGALAGGPVGAAAGLVVQTLIGKRINRAARSTYRVTGSWEQPVITLISKSEARGPAAGGGEAETVPPTEARDAAPSGLPLGTLLEALRAHSGAQESTAPAAVVPPLRPPPADSDPPQ
jgi:uncharacterized protein (TIGR02099 family)